MVVPYIFLVLKIDTSFTSRNKSSFTVVQQWRRHRIHLARRVNSSVVNAHKNREDAVNSLAYEAETRLRDPVYGCVGVISTLQHRLKQVEHDLYNAKKELSTFIGPAALLPLAQHPHHPHHHPLLHHAQNPNSPVGVVGGVGGGAYGISSLGLGLPTGPAQQAHLLMREQQQQQQQHIIDPQQLAAVIAAREQQDMMRSYEQQHQQQQQELVRFNSGFDGVANGTGGGGGVLFNQMGSGVPSPHSLLRPGPDLVNILKEEELDPCLELEIYVFPEKYEQHGKKEIVKQGSKENTSHQIEEKMVMTQDIASFL
ncbi:hypothetical protein MKW98_018222 [Papaver atlanticum]|uniref:LOB domain-containing protein n=1 Tax=Papaver atlanticum TaxID=357466 RepID=A0AAD4RVZ2_9MAGN|nr:hypothetical protein MKW98_018222 [Papaver atlanticum]